VSATTKKALGARHRSATAEHRAAVSDFALAFKAAMGAVRRLRGRESHCPGELS
jgi:hypothetical protein